MFIRLKDALGNPLLVRAEHISSVYRHEESGETCINLSTEEEALPVRNDVDDVSEALESAGERVVTADCCETDTGEEDEEEEDEESEDDGKED